MSMSCHAWPEAEASTAPHESALASAFQYMLPRLGCDKKSYRSLYGPYAPQHRAPLTCLTPYIMGVNFLTLQYDAKQVYLAI